MIAIINCSLNNPGPDTANGNDSNSNYVASDRLSIYYQNVQGLIPVRKTWEFKNLILVIRI